MQRILWSRSSCSQVQASPVQSALLKSKVQLYRKSCSLVSIESHRLGTVQQSIQ